MILKRYYCMECMLNGIEKYYDSEEELLKAHPVLENARQLIMSEWVEL